MKLRWPLALAVRDAEANSITVFYPFARSRAARFNAGCPSRRYVARLMAFLTKLDRDVEITVRPKRRDKGEVSVVLR